MCAQTDGGLLDCLMRETGVRYLSDLWLDPRLAGELLRAVEGVPAERFSRGQWEDAFFYLTRARPVPEEEVSVLRGRLLEWLRKRKRTEAPS